VYLAVNIYNITVKADPEACLLYFLYFKVKTKDPLFFLSGTSLKLVSSNTKTEPHKNFFSIFKFLFQPSQDTRLWFKVLLGSSIALLLWLYSFLIAK